VLFYVSKARCRGLFCACRFGRAARYNGRKRRRSKIHAFMKLPSHQLLACLACALFATLAGAEKADRGKPMNIESDALRYDDLKQTSIFTGRVVLTKGSITIRGSQVEVRQDAEGYQFGVVTSEPGKRAFFRQKRDGVDEFMEGQSETIEYNGRTDLVKLSNNAQLRRYRGDKLADEVTGTVIQYNNSTDEFTVDGGAAPNGEGGRVRAMLTPKAEPASGAVAPTPPGPVLRATPQIGETRK
jgi:lipopolysaccharide export system protein LptA